jgi:hypothetical protein
MPTEIVLKVSRTWKYYYALQSKTLRIDSGLTFTYRIRLFEGISKYQQLRKKSNATVLNIVPASVHTQMT